MPKNNKVYLCIAITMLFLYLSPRMFLGENSHVVIHDNLDWIVAPYKLLGEKYSVFDFDPEIESFMMGTSRFPMQNILNPIIWLYVLFEPFTAYMINEIILRLFAFIGMYLFLKAHLANEANGDIITVGVSLCFALLPYLPLLGLTIAGQPLLLYAFWNILKARDNALDYAIIFVFAFYSSLIFSGVFILFTLSIILIFDFSTKGRLNYKFFGGILLLSILYIIVEFGIISTFLDPTFTSHRSLRDGTWGSKTFLQSTIEIINNFTSGHYTAASLHKWVLFLAVPLALIIAKTMKFNTRLLFILLSISFMISVFYGFWFWSGLLPIKNNITILRTFGFYRFHFLHPVLWYLIFALSVCSISKIDTVYANLGRNLIIFLIGFQMLFIISNNNEVRQNIKSMYLSVRGKEDRSISYRKFFSEELFLKIKEYINEAQEDYRIVSIGLHPAIAQYNGFHTLDGYSSFYSAEYHKKFRELIADELSKNDIWRQYYDNRGSRCYVISWEFRHPFNVYDYTKYKNKSIKELNLNFDVFRELGGKYILSSVEIVDYKENSMNLVKVFESEESPWRIFLYGVI